MSVLINAEQKKAIELFRALLSEHRAGCTDTDCPTPGMVQESIDDICRFAWVKDGQEVYTTEYSDTFGNISIGECYLDEADAEEHARNAWGTRVGSSTLYLNIRPIYSDDAVEKP